ncbi:hypothetical protein LWI28_025021 [Acer negundo]|uniref:Uncharacterized protein n=1 Tax=Acer negundo TaxID=4023 RepID=A0AAD5I7G5_ACENE|nr:hypothetical protein LWI28_025021 [Acer negundo]
MAIPSKSGYRSFFSPLGFAGGWTLLGGISIADFTSRGLRLTRWTGVGGDRPSRSNTSTRAKACCSRISRLIFYPAGSRGRGPAAVTGGGIGARLSFLDPLPRLWALSVEASDKGPDRAG